MEEIKENFWFPLFHAKCIQTETIDLPHKPHLTSLDFWNRENIKKKFESD